MQPEAEGSLKAARESLNFSQNNQLSFQLLNVTQGIPNEQDFLSQYFNRCSYRFYKLCVVLTFLIALLVEFDSITYFFWIFDNIKHYGTLQSFAFATLPTIIAFLFLLIACGQIFLAITKRRSKMAQQSVLLFQYSMIAAVFGTIFKILAPGFTITAGVTAWPLLIATHLLVSFLILRVFKKNHPFARKKKLEGSATDYSLESDFMEQNEAISLELWKYDEKLKSWRYTIYKFWLRLAVTLHTLFLSWGFIAKMIRIKRGKDQGNEQKELTLLSLAESVFLALIFGFFAYCCYEMEIVLIIKRLEKARKALFHLKVCIFVAIIAFIPSCIRLCLSSTESFLIGFGIIIGSVFSAPLITLIGAFYVHKVIEQRDQFVKVSSYNEDSYA